MSLEYAKKACDTLMKKFTPEELPPAGRFHYHQGVFLSGMLHTYNICKDEKYYEYIKAWVDSIIDEEGNIDRFDETQLDDIQPGILLYMLYERTGDERYKIALDTLLPIILNFPRCKEGGLWHKGRYPNQMWLDGLYMAGPVSAEYANKFDKPEYAKMVLEQALLMEKVTKDDKTGLLYHAWDSSRETEWSDNETGKSPEFWGRAIGWVPVATLDDLELLPEDIEGRDELIRMTTDIIKALIPFQSENGMWYQVVDKVDDPNNWEETSCTSLYVAAICKAVRNGYLDKSYLEYAKKGYDAIINNLKSDENGILLDGVCVGTGVGDLEHYYNRPTSVNDLHGMGAFILMCTEAEEVGLCK